MPIVAAAKTLYSQPMFRMMLSSNELFHSNFLQWICETLTEPPAEQEPGRITVQAAEKMAIILGHPLMVAPGVSYFTVHREENKFDLLLSARTENSKKSTPWLAVEVKVKSWPISTQLENFFQGPLNETGHLVLLTLARGENINELLDIEPGRVSCISFSALAHNITQEVNLAGVAPQYINWVNAYSNLCVCLDQFFECMRQQCNPEMTIGDVVELGNTLAPYRLNAIWWKNAIDVLRSEVSSKLHVIGEAENFLLEPNFSNSRGILHCVIKQPLIAWGADLELGVQVQGNSFRLLLTIRIKEEMADRPAQLHNLNGKQARELAENFLINAEAIGLFERRPALAIDEQIEEPLLFDSQSTGGRGGFTLTGYANGPGHGFADYRYKLKDAVTLNQIASEIVKILINDEYHRENLTLSNFRINQDLLNLVLEE